MKFKNFLKTILILSIPTAFQKLITLLVVMADNLMVSSYDASGIAFASVSQANVLTNLFIALCMGLTSGGIVLISQYWGKNDEKKIKATASMIISLSLLISIFTILIIHFFPRQLLSIVLNKSEHEIIQSAESYLKIASLSYLPFALSTAIIAILKGVEIVKFSLYSTIIALISNISFNYLLIFGALGFPRLGIQGAAAATIISRLFECGFITVYFFKKQKNLNYKISDLRQQDKAIWKSYSKFGLPVCLTDSQWAVVGLIKMSIIGHLGKSMINATAVTDMLMNLGTMFTFSLASGASVIVGKAVGQKDYELTHQHSKRIQMLFFSIGIFMSAVVFLVKTPFIILYSLDNETSELAKKMVTICALTLIGTTYHASCFIGINRGAGDSKFVMLVDMICGWLIVLPLSAIMAFYFKLPLHFVYFFTRIDQCFKWIIAYLRLRSDKWIHIIN